MGNHVPWLFEGFTLLLFIHQEHMTNYTQLHYNVDQWYDSINDVHEHSSPDAFGDSHVSRFNQYMYAYLSCIEEFSDDYE